MPNHETNYVTVVGEPAKIKRFLDEAFSDGEETQPKRVLDFNRIVPQPDNIEQGGCPGGAVAGLHIESGEVCWYSWNTANWGTKWGAYAHQLDPEVVGDEGTVQVCLTFDTAWTAPTPIFEAIERRWEVAVHAITIDEGGYPPVFYGEPGDYMYVNTSVERY